jgi:hypothetical protein
LISLGLLRYVLGISGRREHRRDPGRHVGRPATRPRVAPGRRPSAPGIEQQYQQLKEELGLDHFEGRSYRGWQRHVVLTALAYTCCSRNAGAGCRARRRYRSCAL